MHQTFKTRYENKTLGYSLKHYDSGVLCLRDQI